MIFLMFRNSISINKFYKTIDKNILSELDLKPEKKHTIGGQIKLSRVIISEKYLNYQGDSFKSQSKILKRLIVSSLIVALLFFAVFFVLVTE